MASKSIDIKIASRFNADGVLEANKGLAKLSQDIKEHTSLMRKNTLQAAKDMGLAYDGIVKDLERVSDAASRAAMRAEMGVNSYAEDADKRIRAMGGGYKTLEQQLSELANAHKSVGTEAVAAETAATKSAVGLEMAMGLARGSTEQTAKAIALLSQKIPILGKLGVAAFGAWSAAITSVISLVSSLKDLVVTAFNLNQPSKEVKAMSSHFADLKNEAESFKINLAEAEKSASKQTKIFEDEAEAITKMTKAQNEFNRAQELSLAKTEEQKAAINAKWDRANAEAEEEQAQSVRDNKRSQLRDEESRLRKALSAAEKRSADYVESGKQGAKGWVDGYWDEQDVIEETKAKLETNRHAQDILDREEEVAELNIETRKQKEVNAAKEAAQKKLDEETKEAKKTADEKAKAEVEAAKKEEAARLKAVEAERKAREKMEADLQKQRIANINDAIKSQQTISQSAQTEFDKAFAMYRADDKGASVIAEERGYAADYKQLRKDASRYGGKWRIDELSALMAAGDTQGQAAKLEEWRKSSRFTPEVESMVRAVAADNTRTTAEDELRKLNQSVDEHNRKLDALLTMKGGD